LHFVAKKIYWDIFATKTRSLIIINIYCLCLGALWLFFPVYPGWALTTLMKEGVQNEDFSGL
jgi:hypothetical protein